METLVSIASFQALISFLLLIVHDNKNSFDRLMVNFLVLMVLHLTTKFLLLVVLQNEFLFDQLASSFGFAYGPLLYLATKQLVGKKLKKYEALLHFAPFTIISLLYLYAVIGSMGLIGGEHFVSYYKKYMAFLEIPSFLFYNLHNLIFLIKYRGKGALNKLRKNLLIIISTLLLLVIFYALPYILIYKYMGFQETINIRLVPYSLFIAIGYMVVRYKIKSAILKSANTKKDDVENKDMKYEKSSLDIADLKKYQEQLDEYIKKNKPYLNSELTLPDLSNQLNIPRHHLTQLLNSYYQRNFYHFINEHRIAEAIRLLEASDSKGNLLSLAYEVGFHSKSSFNHYFKKVTGQTPSQFRKSIQQAELSST